MKFLAFILNLPYIILGLIVALISLPKRVTINREPFAIVFHEANFWWYRWYQKLIRGMNFANVIILGTDVLPGDLEHELVHARQFERYPFIFGFMYEIEQLRKGYAHNKYEEEARKGNTQNKDVTISPASIDDVMAISEVQRLTYIDTYPNAEFDITLEDIEAIDFYSTDKIESRKKSILDPASPTKIWVAKVNVRVVGYCVIKKDANTNLLRSLYILPEYQKKGIGRKLIDQALEYLDHSKAIHLTVAPYNKKAIEFYKKIGFVISKETVFNPQHTFPTGKIMPETEMVLSPK